MLGQAATESLCLALPATLADLGSPGVHSSVCQNFGIRLCFRSPCPVNVLDSTEETFTEPGWLPGFPGAWSPPSRLAWVCFSSTGGRKLHLPATLMALTQCFPSLDSINVFHQPQTYGSQTHTLPERAVYFSKGQEALLPEPSPSLSAPRGV